MSQLQEEFLGRLESANSKAESPVASSSRTNLWDSKVVALAGGRNDLEASSCEYAFQYEGNSEASMSPTWHSHNSMGQPLEILGLVNCSEPETIGYHLKNKTKKNLPGHSCSGSDSK